MIASVIQVHATTLQLLIPVEKIVIRAQAARGEIRIAEATESSSSKKVVRV